MIEYVPQVVRENPEIHHAQDMLENLKALHEAFLGIDQQLDSGSLLSLARTQLDFRAGKAREETVWEEGEPLTLAQKISTLELADSWNMLTDTMPTKPFDYLVVLGAHKDSLLPRMRHATCVLERESTTKDVILLGCFRPIHPKEGVDVSMIETELDLAIELAQDNLNGKFEVGTISSWDDLIEDKTRGDAQYAVGLVGSIGVRNVVALSGSVPSGYSRATTISTLESLRSFFDGTTARLLFVTTALHLPYQALQVQQVMGDFQHEVVGVGYEGLRQLSVDSPDSQFRMVLQEIGATIKNAVVEII